MGDIYYTHDMYNDKINILLITKSYPPDTLVSSSRMASFVKYLSAFGHNLFVITTGERDPETREDNIYRCKNDCKSVLAIEKYINSICSFISTIIFFDDTRAFTKCALKLSKKIINENDIHIIITSSSPLSTLLIGHKLKKHKPELLWIADLRDELSKNPFFNIIKRTRLKKFEKNYLSKADAIISVSEPLLDGFRENIDSSHVKYHEIRNGYDFQINQLYVRNEIFTITYTGSFYGKIKPDNFFTALSQLKKRNILPEFRVNIIGAYKPLNIPGNINNNVYLSNEVPHKVAIDLIKKADALLLVHPKLGRKGVYTSKLFEYLAALRPIIAAIDKNDVAAELIQKCDAGFVSDYDDIKEIEDAIIKAYKVWNNEETFRPNIELIKGLHRKKQIEKLNDLILELAN